MLVIVLAVVTVVGHGIWVLLASVFGKRAAVGPAAGRACPRCRAPLALSEQRCAACGWPGPRIVPAGSQAALQALRSQLQELSGRGEIDSAARDRLLAVIKAEQARLVEQEQPAQPAAAPVAASAAAPASPPGGEEIVLEPLESSSPASARPAPPAPVAERARRYAASRATAAVEPSANGGAAPPPMQREAFSRLLAAFMEEKNIRWGELVGGLLIVGCSIALVISFWSQIADRPLLKFGLFNGVTAALFAIGIYTERRWKIHTTSHGVLMIATLLVPLNFLAIAAFTQAAPPTDLVSLVGEAVSLVLFGTLVYLAGRVLMPRDAVLLTAGVMVACLMQLVVRRFAGPAMPLAAMYALAAVPVGAYVASTVVAARRRWESGRQASMVVAADDDAPAGGSQPAPATLLVLVGLVSAATLMPLALLLYYVPPMLHTLGWLSPLVAVCGMPALLVGLHFRQQLTAHGASGMQTAGIGVGVMGVLVMLAAVVLAWPTPATLLPTSLATAAVLVATATWFAVPEAHVPAGAALAAAWLVALHLVRGDLAWMANDPVHVRSILLSATSGHALAALAAVFAGVAISVGRIGRREPAWMYALVTAATIIASLAMLAWFGFARAGDPQHITWTLAAYALLALAAAVALHRTELIYAGSTLLLAALVQGIVYRYNLRFDPAQPWVTWITALLAHATAATLLAVALDRLHALRGAGLIRALVRTALATSALAAALMIARAIDTSAAPMAINLAWLAGVWLVVAALGRSPAWLTASQVALVWATLCGVTAAVEMRPWYVAARHPWLDPWFLQAQGLALAGYCLLAGAARWWSARRIKPLATWPGVDHVVEFGLVMLVALLAIYAALPGTMQELTPTLGATAAERVAAPIERFEIAGIPHAHAAGGGAWWLLAAVAGTLAVRMRWSGDWRRLLGLALLAMAAAPLLAVQWEPQMAVASALRWLTAGFFAALSIPLWLRAVPRHRELRDLMLTVVVLIYAAMAAYVCQAALLRTGIGADLQRLWPWVSMWALLAGIAALVAPYAAERPADPQRSARRRHVRDMLLVLAVAPPAILLTFAVARGLEQYPPVGAEPGTWFSQIGASVSYGLPLAAIALVMIGHAVRDRSSPLAFSAGLLANLLVTIVLLLRLFGVGGALDATAWVLVAQANAFVAAVIGLVWLAVLEWHDAPTAAREPPAKGPSDSPLLLATQAALAAALCGVFLLPATANVVLDKPPADWAIAAGSVWGWAAVGLTVAAAVWLNRRRGASQGGIALATAGLVALVALTFARWDDGNWQAYHALLAGACAAAWLVPIAARGAHQLLGNPGEVPAPMQWSAPSVRMFAVLAVVLAIGGYVNDPATPWWTIAVLATIAARNVWMAWHEAQRAFVWIAAMLFVPAAGILWLDWAQQLSPTTGFGQALEFFWIVVVATALVAWASVAVERGSVAARAPLPPMPSGIGFHRVAAWAIVAVLLTTTAAGLLADVVNRPIEALLPLAWLAWLAAAATALACLWDPGIRWPVACLYCVGLLAVGVYLDGLDLQPPLFQWALANALAAYALATSGLWSLRGRLQRMLSKWGAFSATAASETRTGTPVWDGAGHGWLVPANLLLGAGVLLLVVWIELTLDSFTQRMVAAYAVGAQAVAIGLLARGAVRTPLQYLALVWGVLFAVAFGWACLPPDFPAPWLHRLVVTVAALAVVVVVYGFGLVKFLKRENEWTRAAARLVPTLAGFAAVLILVVLGIEVATFVEDGAVPIAWPALVAVALAMAGLAAAALAAALLPGRDPLALSERGRTLYVYAAEILAALLFLHVRVTMPWLFTDWFQQFWPLAVMVIAFVGVGFGELFQRRRQRVLAEPLENTGALLPLLPVVGFWFVSSQVHYSLLLLSIGMLYAGLATLRRSLAYGVLAALAANGSLWYLLSTREGLSLWEHPQLWLIPPALCALAAGHINRGRLSDQQSAGLRYAAAIVIYVSSTADVFIHGVAEAPWLPALLAGLSILGVLAGIMLRVRAFLYLGTAFLAVAILTVIWHAAIGQQQTWILWVAGIITGVLLIALFGVFEKRRDDVLRVVEQLKQWQA